MLKKLMPVTAIGLVVICGLASAAPPEKQQFELWTSGAISANGLDTGNIRNTDKKKLVEFQSCTPMCVPFDLGGFWQDQEYSNGVDGLDCFPTGTVQGAIHVLETNSGEAQAKFWFGSIYKPTETMVTYLLTVTGSFGWDGDFPPQMEQSAYMSADHWVLETEGKGKLRKSSCKGEGDFGEDVLELTILRIPLDP